jgi:hypothetical protein
MKKLLLVTTMLASMSVSAFPVTEKLNGKVESYTVKYGEPLVELTAESQYFLKKASENNYSDIITKYYSANDEVKGKMRYALYEVGKNIKNADIATQIDSFAMTYLKHDNARMVEYWQESVDFNGMRIYQNDSLFDLERINIPMLSEHLNKSLPNKDSTRDNPMTSLHRMTLGLPAVGPDNKNIVICRITYDSKAAYYEMSRTDAVETLIYLNTGMSFGEACLNHKFMKGYWLQRKGHFVDAQGDRKPRH